MLLTDALVADLLKRCKREGDCVIWLGSTTGFTAENQYGVKGYKNKTYYVHRLMYAHKVGAEIPKGSFLRKLCDSKVCVNPSHFECLTREKFYADIQNKGTCSKGHPMAERPSGRRYCPTCTTRRRDLHCKEKQQENRAARKPMKLQLFGTFKAKGYSPQAPCAHGDLLEVGSTMSKGDVLVCKVKLQEEAGQLATQFHQAKARVKVFQGRLFTTKTEDRTLYIYRAQNAEDLEAAKQDWPFVDVVKSKPVIVTTRIEDISTAVRPKLRAAAYKKGVNYVD